MLATSGLGGEIKLWTLPAGDLVTELKGAEVVFSALRFLRGGEQLVSLGFQESIRLWDTKTWDEIRVIDVKGQAPRGLAFSPDEKQAAVLGDDYVYVWSTENWTHEFNVEVGAKKLFCTAFSPDGRWLAVGAADKKIRIWELP